MSTQMPLLLNSFTSVTHRAFYTDRSQIFMRSDFIGINTQGRSVAESHAGASRKAALENHVGEFTQSLPQSENQIHSAQFVPFSLIKQCITGCALLCQGQDEITVSTCASSALEMPTKLCHLHYSELHTFCSCLIDQVSLWTVKKLQIMDLQLSALQLTRTRNSC